MKAIHSRPPRKPTSPRPKSSRRWAWHLRTLIGLRDHLRHVMGDRLREPFESMEPPSLHAEDLTDEMYDRDLARALPPLPMNALSEVEAAIQRIQDGTYGTCTETGRTIPAKRLLQIPWCRTAADEIPCLTKQKSHTHASSQKALSPD